MMDFAACEDFYPAPPPRMVPDIVDSTGRVLRWRPELEIDWIGSFAGRLKGALRTPPPASVSTGQTMQPAPKRKLIPDAC